jgi:D-proline reductase (dithiol) PrdB
MPRLERLSEISRNALLTLPLPVHDGAPFTPLVKPLAACRVALVTTAGLHLRDDHPFAAGDPSFRVLPTDSGPAAIIQSHVSIGFDRTPIQRDLNVTYPIDRLRELVERGAIGGLGPNGFSFMGAQRDTTRIEQETAPEVARRLRDELVDVVLLTPT